MILPLMLRSMTFDDESLPATVTLEIEANVLFDLARLAGGVSHAGFFPQARESVGDFYNWVSGHVANRFYEDGLNEHRKVLKYNRTLVSVTVTQTPKDASHMVATLRNAFADIRNGEDPSESELTDEELAQELAGRLYQSGARFSTAYTEDD